MDPKLPYSGGHSSPDEMELVQTLKRLVGYAYDIRPEFVFGGPKWAESELFDIEGKVDESDIPIFQNMSGQQKDAMLRPVLESRFGLRVHREVRVLQVFDLVVAKGGLGPKFTPHSPANPPFSLGGAGETFDGFGVEMPLLTRGLSEYLSGTIDRPILDKTGLTGKYDFILQWSSPTDQGTSSHPDVFTAVREQLGLRLEPAREPVETIIIDSAERPSEN
jgi:uncharacterized protein (TIGR03435 family)